MEEFQSLNMSPRVNDHISDVSGIMNSYRTTTNNEETNGEDEETPIDNTNDTEPLGYRKATDLQTGTISEETGSQNFTYIEPHGDKKFPIWEKINEMGDSIGSYVIEHEGQLYELPQNFGFSHPDLMDGSLLIDTSFPTGMNLSLIHI